jgi:hypothetical protein
VKNGPFLPLKDNNLPLFKDNVYDTPAQEKQYIINGFDHTSFSGLLGDQYLLLCKDITYPGDVSLISEERGYILKQL